MQTRNTHGKIAVLGLTKASVPDHAKKRVLIREFADAFHKVLITVFVTCNGLAHSRDHVETVQIIKLLQARIWKLAKFQHHETTTGLENAIGFGQSILRPGHVPDAKADRVRVKRIGIKRQRHGITNHPVKAVGQLFCFSPFAPFNQHWFCQIQNRCVTVTCAFKESERDITGSSGHVQQSLARARREPIHHCVFPQPMDAAAHDVVHDVIARSHGGKHALNPARFFMFGNVFKSEMGGFGVLGHAQEPVISIDEYRARAGKTNGPFEASDVCAILRQVLTHAALDLHQANATLKWNDMPELPEVETVRKGLEPAMTGTVITQADVNRPDLRWPFPERMAERLTGARVERLRRRSKYILADLNTGETLLIHLGMSGRMLVSGDPLGQFVRDHPAAEKHDHVVLHLENGARITFNDPRRFGAMDLFDTGASHKLLDVLGPEPLGNDFHEAHLIREFTSKMSPVKAALLDQRVVAGLGNIYVCEALFRARIAPTRKAGKISRARVATLVPIIRDVLAEAIAAGGSSLKDFRQADGELGYFQHSFDVYGRENEPCKAPDCGQPIRRITQSGRSTFYCLQCQR